MSLRLQLRRPDAAPVIPRPSRVRAFAVADLAMLDPVSYADPAGAIRAGNGKQTFDLRHASDPDAARAILETLRRRMAESAGARLWITAPGGARASAMLRVLPDAGCVLRIEGSGACDFREGEIGFESPASAPAVAVASLPEPEPEPGRDTLSGLLRAGAKAPSAGTLEAAFRRAENGARLADTLHTGTVFDGAAPYVSQVTARFRFAELLEAVAAEGCRNALRALFAGGDRKRRIAEHRTLRGIRSDDVPEKTLSDRFRKRPFSESEAALKIDLLEGRGRATVTESLGLSATPESVARARRFLTALRPRLQLAEFRSRIGDTPHDALDETDRARFLACGPLAERLDAALTDHAADPAAALIVKTIAERPSDIAKLAGELRVSGARAAAFAEAEGALLAPGVFDAGALHAHIVSKERLRGLSAFVAECVARSGEIPELLRRA